MPEPKEPEHAQQEQAPPTKHSKGATIEDDPERLLSASAKQVLDAEAINQQSFHLQAP